MTPADQRKAARAAYAKAWRAKNLAKWNTYLKQHMAGARRVRREKRLRELSAMPSLTLPQVVEWLRLRALVTHCLLTSTDL